MKNASIKEMIRKQKMDANDRRDLVSDREGRGDWGRRAAAEYSPGCLFFVGNSGEEAAAEEQTN